MNENKFKKDDSVWVKASVAEPIPDEVMDIKLYGKFGGDERQFYIAVSEIYTTEQILQEHESSDTQKRSRLFRERDKVHIVERYGRKPDLLPGFECGKIYEVRDDEEWDGYVWLKNPIYDNEDMFIPWFWLDLVEEAPYPRFVVIRDEVTKEYKIVDTEQKIAVSTFSMEFHAIQYVNRQCDNLNKKGKLVLL